MKRREILKCRNKVVLNAEKSKIAGVEKAEVSYEIGVKVKFF